MLLLTVPTSTSRDPEAQKYGPHASAVRIAVANAGPIGNRRIEKVDADDQGESPETFADPPGQPARS